MLQEICDYMKTKNMEVISFKIKCESNLNSKRLPYMIIYNCQMNGDNKLFQKFRSVIEIRLKKWKERMEEKKKTKLEKKIKKNVIFHSFKKLGLILEYFKIIKIQFKNAKKL